MMTEAEKLVWAAAFTNLGDSSKPWVAVEAAYNAVTYLRMYEKQGCAYVPKDAVEMLREFCADRAPGPTTCPRCGALARTEEPGRVTCMGCGLARPF